MTFYHIFGANKKEVEIRLIAVGTKLTRLISKFGFKPIPTTAWFAIQIIPARI